MGGVIVDSEGEFDPEQSGSDVSSVYDPMEEDGEQLHYVETSNRDLFNINYTPEPYKLLYEKSLDSMLTEVEQMSVYVAKRKFYLEVCNVYLNNPYLEVVDSQDLFEIYSDQTNSQGQFNSKAF